MTDIHLYVDDERDMPPQFTDLVRTPEEAIEFIDANRENIITISFDHDAGYTPTFKQITFRPVIDHLIEIGFYPMQMFFHSANPSGARWMLNRIADHAPQDVSKFYEVVNDWDYYK